MRRIDFFRSARENLNVRADASYQSPQSYKGTHEKCIELFKSIHGVPHFFLTKSCTQSLEMAFAGLDLPLGSEIILPSYAFVSCANAINNLGYKCVFVDCTPDTFNICPAAIETAISPKTRAIMTINYGGVGCDYQRISAICKQHQLYLVEDNAHGFLAQYQGRLLGNFGDISTISFDHMKNISCEEGGGISINHQQLLPAFRMALEFGTNRADFFESKVSNYEWMSKGSNCFLAESLSEILYEQMQNAQHIFQTLKTNWQLYFRLLLPLAEIGKLKLATVPKDCVTNGHIFWLCTKSMEERQALLSHLKSAGVHAVFHYSALHRSKYGQMVGEMRGSDTYTLMASQQLIRLPQHHLLSEEDIYFVCENIYSFYGINPEF